MKKQYVLKTKIKYDFERRAFLEAKVYRKILGILIPTRHLIVGTTYSDVTLKAIDKIGKNANLEIPERWR